MTVTLVLPSSISGELEAAAAEPLETAGVLTVRIVKAESGTRLLGRKMLWVPQAAYKYRGQYGLSVTSDGYVPALAEAESRGEACIWLHTHPTTEGVPSPSSADEEVDRNISDLFKLRSGSGAYGTLIVSPRRTGLSFTGRFEHEKSESIPIDRIWIVGERLRLIHSYNRTSEVLDQAFDRNVRAFGPLIQSTLGNLHVGIVGCGGTGSAVAEQFARLGVRSFSLLDPDVLSASNTTRVYGSFPDDVGRHKVNVLADHLRHIAPDTKCVELPMMLTVEKAARKLLNCDLLIGCTDDNAGRLVLSRLASYFLLPVIDCGVLISSGDHGELSGIDARATLLYPGQACLVCRGRIDLKRAASELIAPEERIRLENEGYAAALGRVEPAVVSFTTVIAAAVVCEVLERLIGYGPRPVPSEILLRLHDRAISTNSATPRPGHYCDPASCKIGIGYTEPFLEQLWVA